MSPAVQSPILALVPDTRTADVIKLPKRLRDLDRQRDSAARRAMTPDVIADLREAVDQVIARLKRHPELPLHAALYAFGRHMYVAGRIDEAADQQTAAEQTDALAQATVHQLADLIAERRSEGGDAS